MKAQMDGIQHHIDTYWAKMDADMAKMKDELKKLETFRQSHLDIRQSVLSIWVRDTPSKATEPWEEEILGLFGDVRTDSVVVTECYEKSSTEWQHFSTLYGLTPDNMKDLGIVYKFPFDPLFVANTF